MTDNTDDAVPEQSSRALTVYAPEPGDPDEAGPTAAAESAASAQGIALAAERDRLARALRETHRQLATAQAELMAVSNSATMELGKALAKAAKRPWIGGPRLPAQLYRLWRERRAVRAARGVEGGGFRSADEESWAGILLDPGTGATGDRFLATFTVPGQAWAPPGRAADPDDGLVVAGVLTSESCATLAPDATAVQLLPHDAVFVLEGSGADLVVIEAAALLPGGAWAHAGDPAAADRGRRLADLVDLARALGKPVVFLRNAPSYLIPYLDWLGGYCDAVIDGDLGVQLARFNPIDLPAVRPADPVYAGTRNPREAPAVRRMLDELTGGELAGPGLADAELADAELAGPGLVGQTAGPAGAVRVIGEPSWRSAPDAYRARGLFVAASAAQAREQLATGARVIGPVTGDATVTGAAPASTAAEAAQAIAAARDAGPRTMAETKALLHELFEAHATPVRLAEIVRQAGLPARPVPGRRVAVLAGVRDATEAGRLADSVLAQRLRPSEVVVWLAGEAVPAAGTNGSADGNPPASGNGARGDNRAASGNRAAEGIPASRQAVAVALGRLDAEGVSVTVVPGTGRAAAARAATAPWAAPWDPATTYPASYLLELVCALECSRADAAGTAGGADYAFTDRLDPLIARTALYRDGGPPPDTWARRGLRLFAVDLAEEGS